MSIKTAICKTCDAFSDVPVIGAILKPKPKVAIIRLSGIIAESAPRRSSISYNRFYKSIEDAFEVYNLKAVMLVINSPGGSPAQSALLGDHIRRLAVKKEIPVYAFVEDVAASGGYWLACAADEIYANATSIVGSIGVISAGFGFKDLIERYGIERRIHTSGKDKSFMDPFAEEKPGDVKRLKDLQGDLHKSFIDWVKTRRGDKIKGKDSYVFEGQFWIAGQALALGIIDGLGEARSFAKEKFGDEIKFAEFGPDKSFIPALLGTDTKASLAQDAIETLEERAVWNRYGL